MKRRKFLEAGALLGGLGLGLNPATAANAFDAKTTPDSKKKTLWMFISDMTHPDVHLVTPTLAWIAKEAGVEFESYQEAQRDGRLFARTGSTIIGGFHHQQFNYLNAIFNVSYILLGNTTVFRSSIQTFGAPILAEAESPVELYRALFKNNASLVKPKEALFGLRGITEINGKKHELGPYIFPDIFYRKALAFSAQDASGAVSLLNELGISKTNHMLLSTDEKQKVTSSFSNSVEIDTINSTDSYKTITLRIAERWKKSAKGLAFGDPAAILSQLPSHCRKSRIAVYGEKILIKPSEIVVTAYTEQKTSVAQEVKKLAQEIGNLQIVGRQTGDGDLFEWSKAGVCIQIMDPNRPAFPIVETVPHFWAKPKQSIFDLEPDDATLEKYAADGKILATLMWHSGEMAHNEAMLNLFDVVSKTGIKMGMGVHAARYETSPQLWEMINVPRERGGVQGYIEPVLHSGGMGVLAEINCPPALLDKHCKESLSRIRSLAGDAATPKGYYAFMDSDYKTLTKLNPEIYKVIAANGLEYCVSSITPGRNQILHQSGNCTVLNQSARVVCNASPFVRITTVEELKEANVISPGWFIGTLDAPVIAFNDYIWRHGPRFMEIVDFIMNDKRFISATPHTISRYAKILKAKGYLAS